MKTKKNGFMYCVYTKDGEDNKYTEECKKSIQSLKDCIPDASISVYTNASMTGLKNVNVIYDENIVQAHIAKAYALLKSPYDKTVFIDTDILVHSAGLNAIFDALTDDIPFAATPLLYNEADFLQPRAINTGLLGVKQTKYTKKIINKWINLFHDLYDKNGVIMDQFSFKKIMDQDFHRIYLLPPWFHFRPGLFEKWIKNAVITHQYKTPIYGQSDAVRDLIGRLETYYSELPPSKRSDSIKDKPGE